jgi:precorrin-3B C17-methyltransferase
MKGKVYLVGIGSGSHDDMTYGAVAVLGKVDVIIGQRACLDMLGQLRDGVEVIGTDMSPLERSRLAAEKALGGKNVAIVSAGDPGIYAIASTFFSYLKSDGLDLEVEVVPGVPLANSVAGCLGSPLGGDFAVISLADQATAWSDIRKRLAAAAEADFVIVIYNPVGKIGTKRLKEAIELLLGCRKEDTPVGVASGVASHKEKITVTTLGELAANNILDADSLLIIGNSETFVYKHKMITPRGYIEGVGY